MRKTRATGIKLGSELNICAARGNSEFWPCPAMASPCASPCLPRQEKQAFVMPVTPGAY